MGSAHVIIRCAAKISPIFSADRKYKVARDNVDPALIVYEKRSRPPGLITDDGERRIIYGASIVLRNETYWLPVLNEQRALSYRSTHLPPLGSFLRSMTTMTRRLLTEKKTGREGREWYPRLEWPVRPWCRRDERNDRRGIIMHRWSWMPPMTMRRRPDSITTRLCPHYRFQKGRQKILNYDTVDIRHKHHAIAALPSTRGNCENGRVVENNAGHDRARVSFLLFSTLHFCHEYMLYVRELCVDTLCYKGEWPVSIIITRSSSQVRRVQIGIRTRRLRLEFTAEIFQLNRDYRYKNVTYNMIFNWRTWIWPWIEIWASRMRQLFFRWQLLIWV